jgi:hypothetical protein
LSRPVSEVIRRGFDNTVANWQLLLIRVAESAIVLAFVFVTVLAAIVPVIVSVVRGEGFEMDRPDRFLDLVIMLLTEHWLLIAYLLVLVSVLLTAILAIRSFVEGASTRIFLDGEAAAESSSRFAAFDVQRWFDGGKASWWPIFLIYNIVACFALLGALMPLLVILGALAIGGAGGAALGCVVVPILALGMVAFAIVIALWNQKAIVICVARGLGARASVKAGWREVMDDFPRHLGVAAIVGLIAFGAAMVLSVMSMGAGFGHRAGIALAFAPMQVAASFAQNAVTAIASTWFIACFVALTRDNRG